MSILYQVYATVHVGPGLGAEAAELSEVKAAVRAAGLDDAEVEAVDDDPGAAGLYLAPIPPEQERWIAAGAKSVTYALPIPEKDRIPGPKPEFGHEVCFYLEMP